MMCSIIKVNIKFDHKKRKTCQNGVMRDTCYECYSRCFLFHLFVFIVLLKEKFSSTIEEVRF